LGSALGELNRLSERLSFPDAVRDEAVCIHKNASERGLARRRSVPIVASSIYAACREKGVPASLDEVAAASGLNKSDIAKCYRLLVTELDLRIPVADPAECVARVASRAKVNSKVEADALGILGRARRAGITAGMYPPGLAASALYLASLLNGQYLTQTEVA